MIRFRAFLVAPIMALITVAQVASADVVVSGDLARQANTGIRLEGNDDQIPVRSVEEGSAAANAGIVEGDHVVAVNGQHYGTAHE